MNYHDQNVNYHDQTVNCNDQTVKYNLTMNYHDQTMNYLSHTFTVVHDILQTFTFVVLVSNTAYSFIFICHIPEYPGQLKENILTLMGCISGNLGQLKKGQQFNLHGLHPRKSGPVISWHYVKTVWQNWYSKMSRIMTKYTFRVLILQWWQPGL